MESRIKKREKYYSKLEKQLETQANAMKNSAQMYFNNMAGLGTNSVNLGNYMGTSAAALQMMEQWNGKNPLDATKTLTPEEQKALALYMQGAFSYDSESGVYKASDGTTVSKEDYNGKYQKLASVANTQVSQMQQYASNCKLNYENNVSIWLQAAKEELEAQQEWEMDLLAEEQADYEAEKEGIAAELELVKQRKEAIEQELGSSIKDAAPKFGLA